MAPPRKSKDIKFINPPNLLKQKVGFGGIDPKLVQKAQKLIEEVKFDFAPYAQEFIKQIDKAHDELESKKKGERVEGIEHMIIPVMELKANAAMFNYKIMTDIARVLLYFLECLDDVNQDTMTVIDAHITSLKRVLSEKVKGNTGREGEALIVELDNACMRYFKKYDIDHDAAHKNKEKKRQI